MRTTNRRRSALSVSGLSVALAVAGAGTALAQDEAAEMGTPTASWDFEADAQGWESIIVDLPDGYDPAVGDLRAEWAPLPEGLEGNGLYTQGANQSDDLFMGWKVYLDHPDAIRRAIQYVDENPVKWRLPRQRWPFVVEYDGWPLHPGHNPNSPYAKRLRSYHRQR